MGLDVSGYQVTVIVKDPEGAEYPLWMSQPGAGGVSLGSALGPVNEILGMSGPGAEDFLTADDLAGMDLPVVESMELELGQGLIGKTTIQIAAPYDLGMKLLASSMFKIGNIYRVRIGYPSANRYTPWFESLATKPTVTIDPDSGLSATLNGDATTAAVNGSSSKVYTGKSYKEIIKEIAADHKWEVEFPGGGSLIGDALAAVGIGGGAAPSPFDESRESMSQGNDDDWHFIQRICRSISHHAYMGYAEDGALTLRILERKDKFDQTPRYGFLSRSKPDFEYTFPILGFESSFEGVYLPGLASKVVSSDIDMEKKEQTDEATAETSDEAVLGAGDDASVIDTSKSKIVDGVTVQYGLEGDDRAGERLHVSARDPVKPKEAVESHRKEMQIRGGVTASVTTFGIPDLLPAEVVDVGNLGIFEGLYLVDGIRHTVNESDWTMLLLLLNNGVAGGVFHKFFTKKAEKSNKEQVSSGLGVGSGPGASIVEAVTS